MVKDNEGELTSSRVTSLTVREMTGMKSNAVFNRQNFRRFGVTQKIYSIFSTDNECIIVRESLR